MSGRAPSAPELLPILSRGKHRSSRKGACFMERASVLAGERWSDHPRCTHPLLGELARLVNDCTSDAGRQELAVLIPSVVGLTSDDVRTDARIALRAATAALPVAAAERQNALAVAVINADSVLAVLDGRPTGDLLPQSRAALDTAPEARRWGRRAPPWSAPQRSRTPPRSRAPPPPSWRARLPRSSSRRRRRSRRRPSPRRGAAL